MTANKARGEISIDTPKGKLKLCLTMRAMAELEEALGIESLAEIGSKLAKPNSKSLVTILTILIHGGGNKEITEEEIWDWPFDMAAFTDAVTAAFSASGISDDGDKPKGN